MNEKLIIVLAGSNSPEREISLKTGESIYNELIKGGLKAEMLDPKNFASMAEMAKQIKDKSPFIVFNALHGDIGENGKIQALFELENIPYTGCGSKTSAICMDKLMSSLLVRALGFDVPEKMIFGAGEFDIEPVKELGFPVVVKPNDAGSSMGTSIVEKEQDVKKAFDEASKYSTSVLVEEFINGQEIMVTVLDEGACPPVEVRPKQGFYDYHNKYTPGATEYLCPAPLTEIDTELVQQLAEHIYIAFDCTAYARVDFIYDGEKFYFLELNTLPGMTNLSLTPMAAMAAGITFDRLLVKIIQSSLACKR